MALACLNSTRARAHTMDAPCSRRRLSLAIIYRDTGITGIFRHDQALQTVFVCV